MWLVFVGRDVHHGGVGCSSVGIGGGITDFLGRIVVNVIAGGIVVGRVDIALRNHVVLCLRSRFRVGEIDGVG